LRRASLCHIKQKSAEKKMLPVKKAEFDEKMFSVREQCFLETHMVKKDKKFSKNSKCSQNVHDFLKIG
jgi:hypothetical protein